MTRLKKVLAIDGGGIRGIIPGQFLLEMEKQFGISVSDHFDLVAGTSTGGILTCAYLCPDGQSGRPKFSAEEVVGLYFEKGCQIFNIPTFHRIRTVGGLFDEKYPAAGLESVLQSYFGDIWLSELLKPTVITSYDIEKRKGHFFYQHKANQIEGYDFKVKDLCRATSAAPTYFECANIISKKAESYALIDGGVFVNNPALVAYAEGRQIFERDNGEKATAKDMKILSLGTGYTRKAYEYDKAKRYGMAQWVQPVIDVMMSASAEVADFQLQKIYDTITNPKQYLRVDSDLVHTDVNPEMDNTTPQNMKALKAHGIKLFEENKAALGEWLGL